MWEPPLCGGGRQRQKGGKLGKSRFSKPDGEESSHQLQGEWLGALRELQVESQAENLALAVTGGVHQFLDLSALLGQGFGAELL